MLHYIFTVRPVVPVTIFGRPLPFLFRRGKPVARSGTLKWALREMVYSVDYRPREMTISLEGKVAIHRIRIKRVGGELFPVLEIAKNPEFKGQQLLRMLAKEGFAVSQEGYIFLAMTPKPKKAQPKKASEPPRPANVPANYRWSEADQAWVR